ncbi:large subunit ribosomal protein L6e [Nematocida sp. AWRm80]|nr:large subunit ribosomal protein L6e [Nematocida sp. AWRm80]
MIRNIKLNIQEGEKYNADDIPRKVLTWIKKNPRHVDEVRTDVVEGQTVVILSGKHASMRGILVKRLPKNLVLVARPVEPTGVECVILNQRYIHPVSVFVPISKETKSLVKVNPEIKKIDDWTAENAVDLSMDSLVTIDGVCEQVEKAISEECAKVKGLKTYFRTPFTLPKGVDPLSAFY